MSAETPSSVPESREPGPQADGTAGLARRIGLFDATMVVVGGIVGAGIFRNPHVVAMEVSEPALILGAWLLGGLIALAGAFIYAELTALRPAVGGQYAFFKEAFHPALAFLYGWALLLVIQTGGMAAVSMTFADYSIRLLQSSGAGDAVAALDRLGHLAGLDAGRFVAILALAGLTLINCLGVRAGAAFQSLLTVLKMLAIAGLVLFGIFLVPAGAGAAPDASAPLTTASLATHFGAAMVPVLFAYGGWQTACFIAGEVRNPRRNLPLALLLGVAAVITLYLAVNWICLRTLGAKGLAASTTPAADVAKLALGAKGTFLISAGIVISTLGFLSQGMLTAPRVYFAMAEDGLFFRSLATIHPVTQAPVAAIALQGVTAILIALTGRYEQILNYVVSVDFIFYGLTAVCVFVFRRRSPQPAAGTSGKFRIPGHPFTTLFFIACCWIVVLNSIHAQPVNSLIGLVFMASGLPVYFAWQRLKTKR